MLFALSLIHSVVFGIAGFLNLLAVGIFGSSGNAGKPGIHHSGKAFLVFTGNVCELCVLLLSGNAEYLSFMSNSDYM